jgi:diguanylate cyclase (GGDEF)-like protein
MKKSATGSHAVIICDLDHFKSINDGFGHRAGDTVIRAFANLLSDRAPAGAIVARVGGEEFAVLLSDAHAPEALSFAHTLREAMSTMAISGLPASFRTTASFGVSGVRGSQDLYDALERADKALYEAKRSGRNSVRYHAA